MGESDTAGVECPLCGESFDPTAAGGWCTNPDCGEWQHERDVTPGQRASVDDPAGASNEPETDDGTDTADPDGSSDSTADAPADSGPAVDPAAAESADARPADGESGDADPTDPGPADADTRTDDGAADDAADDDAAVGDDAGADEAADPAPVSGTPSDAAEGAGDAETFECPGCGSTLAAAVSFCPDCGEDVGDLPAADDGPALEGCPGCGADVGPEDNFCAACGEDLAAHRTEPVALDECPDCGAEVDADDRFCAACGADLDAHRSANGDGAEGASDDDGSADSEGSAPEALALTAHDRSVVVRDGDAVGREVRSLLTEAGRPEDEAVRVHREHVRFVREAGRFHVVDLGANPTRLNGAPMERGDREPVEPGDELELSDVVTLTVEAA